MTQPTITKASMTQRVPLTVEKGDIVWRAPRPGWLVRTGLALALVALGACAQSPAPTSVAGSNSDSSSSSSSNSNSNSSSNSSSTSNSHSNGNNININPAGAPSMPAPTDFLEEANMKWTTRCVGRVAMQFPEQGQAEWSQAFHGGHFKRLPRPMGLPVFWQGIERIKAQYQGQKHFDHSSMLAHFARVNERIGAVIHYRSELTRYGPGIRTFVWLNDYHAYELEDGRTYAEDVEPTPGVFAEAIARNTQAVQHIEPLLYDSAMPEQAGLCIDGAVVTDYTGWNAKVSYAVKLREDIRLALAYGENLNKAELYTGFEELRFDEKRAEVLPQYGAAHREFTVLRKRERVLDGLLGQEFIARTVDKDGVKSYRMQWDVRGANGGGITKPFISIHLNTSKYATNSADKPYPPLPSEARLIAFWDQALNSFRVIPDALPDGQRIEAFNQDDGQTPYKAP